MAAPLTCSVCSSCPPLVAMMRSSLRCLTLLPKEQAHVTIVTATRAVFLSFFVLLGIAFALVYI